MFYISYICYQLYLLYDFISIMCKDRYLYNERKMHKFFCYFVWRWLILIWQNNGLRGNYFVYFDYVGNNSFKITLFKGRSSSSIVNKFYDHIESCCPLIDGLYLYFVRKDDFKLEGEGVNCLKRVFTNFSKLEWIYLRKQLIHKFSSPKQQAKVVVPEKQSVVL